MEQLSAQDASFYYQETPETPLHVGSVAILDPATSPYGPLDLATLTRFYEARLHLMPMARRRLVHVPFNADHPYWIEDASFDLEFHLRETALPTPVDWRRFYHQCARILSRPLDLERPPWEVYLIHNLDGLDGLPKGAVGLLTKMHHVAVDGRSGTDMAIAMADTAPEMASLAAPPPWQGEAVPSEAELMARTFVGNLMRPAHATGLLVESLGNQVSAMFLPIGTHLEDPLERLEVIRDATRSAKEMTNAVGAELMTRYGEFVPAALFNLAQRLTAEYSRANRAAAAFNCSITNVPGPQVPLYTMGCRLVTTLGYGPVVHNMGLIMPIGSYCGELTISFTACREMVPDPEFFSDCVRASFAAVRRATLGDAVAEKVAAIARDYQQMAESALAEVRESREPAGAVH